MTGLPLHTANVGGRHRFHEAPLIPSAAYRRGRPYRRLYG
jgi:hypothetical protein